MALEDQQNFLLFDNEANFALLDTPEGALYNNGLYEQLTYVMDNLPTGWNQFHPIFGENHNDWAAGGVGSDTLVGDSYDDLSCDADNVKPVDNETTQSNDVLYGGSGFYLDYDNITNPYIQSRILPEDDGDESTQPPSFDDKVIDIDMDDFDLNVIADDFGLSDISPRFDYAGDELIGGRGNDTVFGQFGNDTIDGGGGADYLFGGRNADLMDGDYLDESQLEGVDLSLRQEGEFSGCDDGDQGDVMFGERGKDTMYGGDDSVFGYTGWVYDDFRGSAGQLCTGYFRTWNYDGDWMSGGRGADEMWGENGFDTMYGDQCADTMSGGDHYDLMFGGRANDLMTGGTEFSVDGGLDLGDDISPSGFCETRCAYEGNFDETGRYLRPEGLHSEYRGGDTMFGGTGYDTMYGGVGDDLMYGGKHADSMFGGDDDDRMLGEEGADWMEGNDGWDDMSGGGGRDTMFGGNGDDYMEGNGGDDDMYGDDGRDIMHGNDGMDYMEGGNNGDIMYGEADMDTMHGQDGDDCMHGGGDRDFMTGGEGNDKMDGGEDNDTMIGGAGEDTIWISGGTSTKYEIVAGDEVNTQNYQPTQESGDQDTFVYNFSFDGESNTAVGDSGYVFIADFRANEDVLQLCFDDPVTFCCDEDEGSEVLPNGDHPEDYNLDGVADFYWDYWNDHLLRAISQPDENGQHAVRVVDNGVDTLIIFDDTEYVDGQDAANPEGQDASDPEHHNDEVIWLQGVTGGIDRPFATLWDMHEAGYRVEIHHPGYEDGAKLLGGDQYGEGDWTYASCEIDCGCEIRPFGPFDDEEPQMEVLSA